MSHRITTGRHPWLPVWRSARYLLVTLVTTLVTLCALPLLCVPTLTVAWAQRHQARAAALLGRPTEPHPPTPGRALPWLITQLATGLPVGAIALLCLGNLVIAPVVMLLWWAFPAASAPRLLLDVAITNWGAALALGLAQLLLLAALAWAVLPPLARLHARCCVVVLAPSPAERLAERVEVLTRTRADVLQAHSAELRRIERDLHDGTQARLVALAIQLAMARESLPEASDTAARILRQAHADTEDAMAELRSVIRTIYPPVLADNGLAGALRMLATRAGVPTRIDIDRFDEIPAAVEAVTYFTVTETLANIARHSGATQASVHVTRTGDRLLARIADDGIGGADESRGTGLDGIRRRVAALDGTLSISSPAGGSTTITMELPCA